MITIQGRTKATIMIDEIDETTRTQVTSMTNHPAFKEDFVIMPDCHAGK